MSQGGKKKKRAANRSVMLAKKIIIKDGGTVRPHNGRAATGRGRLRPGGGCPVGRGGPGRAGPAAVGENRHGAGGGAAAGLGRCVRQHRAGAPRTGGEGAGVRARGSSGAADVT